MSITNNANRDLLEVDTEEAEVAMIHKIGLAELSTELGQ